MGTPLLEMFLAKFLKLKILIK